MLKEITRWFETHGEDTLKRLITSKSLIQTESFDTPSWLHPADNIEALKDYRGEGVSDYYISFLETGDKSISLKPGEPFSGVDLYVSGVSHTESIEVTVEFRKKSGGTETDTVKLDRTPRFNITEAFPIHLSIDEMSEMASISVEFENKKSASFMSRIITKFLCRLTHRDFIVRDVPRVGMPVPVQQKKQKPPIILISIDTLRYDTAAEMEPVFSAMGKDATVPAEPRTKGHWTPASHGSMFTGVHPGEHKYVGVGEASNHPIHPDLITIPELLANRGYKCSGIASHTRILPEGGFGRGFYRYQFQKAVDWLDRKNDSRTAVNQLLQWIERDRLSDHQSNRNFYFLHVFDPHSPYIPDHPSAVTDVKLKELHKALYNDEDIGSNSKSLNIMKEYYDLSVKYTARQISRLITGLKENKLFNESMIIVTGDHGEIFGEFREFGHESLYYPNIKPFMIVKTPEDSDWEVPDTASTLDFLPTIAKLVGDSIPDQCQGQAWQQMTEERNLRITEAIKEDVYELLVEKEGIYSILRYNEQYPERPREPEIKQGTISEEYYRLSDINAGEYKRCGSELDDSFKQDLREQAEKFITKECIVERSRQQNVRAIEETEDQLRHLGYK